MIDLRVPRRVGFETPTRWFSGVATEDFFPLADFLNMGVIWVYRLDKKADDRYPNTCAKAFQIEDRRRRDQREHDCNVNRRATPRQAFKERLGKLHLGLDPSARRVFRRLCDRKNPNSVIWGVRKRGGHAPTPHAISC